MILGIVGHEEKKFTKRGRKAALAVIEALVKNPQVTEVVSGKCHLGGIDVWAIEIAKKLGKKTTEYPAKVRNWEGFKKRNLQIVDRSDMVYCIVVDNLPDSYSGMTFKLCYHCGKKDHQKSGGCWTMKQAIKKGKIGELIIVKNK